MKRDRCIVRDGVYEERSRIWSEMKRHVKKWSGTVRNRRVCLESGGYYETQSRIWGTVTDGEAWSEIGGQFRHEGAWSETEWPVRNWVALRVMMGTEMRNVGSWKEMRVQPKR